jgi:hypothetical protein
MPTVLDCLNHAKWLIEKGRGQEAAVLYLPRVESQRRRENKEKSHWIRAKVAPEVKSMWETERDRFITLCVDPNIAYTVMFEILGSVSDEAIVALSQEEKPF